MVKHSGDQNVCISSNNSGSMQQQKCYIYVMKMAASCRICSGMEQKAVMIYTYISGQERTKLLSDIVFHLCYCIADIQQLHILNRHMPDQLSLALMSHSSKHDSRCQYSEIDSTQPSSTCLSSTQKMLASTWGLVWLACYNHNGLCA